ncbi:MAG: AAA family ATPase [Chitinivibrionales bacterium]|nr:AAA family ATPase [Chitinivibrionales bacterium]MBD3395878.1 AAA family ATPase [Chitinivibrionales bacterium]
MKNYILDTTVLLHDAQALFAFEENNVVIPISVIEDIDHFKKDVSETGRNARHVSRVLDGLRRRGAVTSGVKLDSGGTVYVKTGSEKVLRQIASVFRERNGDVYTLAVAVSARDSESIPAVLVTKDINLRIKADALGLTVEDYESDRVDIEELYSGSAEIRTAGGRIDTLNKDGRVVVEEELLPNQYIALIDVEDEAHVALGRFDAERNRIVRLYQAEHEAIWRVNARNREQAFAFDALLTDSIGLVTLLGKAGTGKTLLAVAAAIYKTVDENVFSRILVSRPTFPMGKDIGYLPGTVEEKLTPWMYPIADNTDLIMRNESRARRQIRGFRELVDMGILVIEPLTYIRGRSIHNQYLIIDEAQNLTPHEMKTIITRVGEGTKIIITGDPYQIDNLYIDSSSNGLTFVVERFKRESISAHVTLRKGERSVLSELAANLL